MNLLRMLTGARRYVFCEPENEWRRNHTAYRAHRFFLELDLFGHCKILPYQVRVSIHGIAWGMACNLRGNGVARRTALNEKLGIWA